MNRPQKFKILQRTTQTQWSISKMVSETTRLQLYLTTYPRKDKYESRHIVKKRESIRGQPIVA